MMVTFVSQCEKNALKKTRRVLDSFADRIGDNTWQTIITKEGLDAVRKLLRRSASKSTAVSCHWIRSRSRSELLWVVGNRDKFNERGVVPVHYTESDMLEQYVEIENWKALDVVKYAVAFAALFHDFGKATILFQGKIDPNVDSESFEPYRHEWISLRIFQAFVGERNDSEWMESLAQSSFEKELLCFKDGVDVGEIRENNPLQHLPSFAQLIAWLILSHHKQPLYPEWQAGYNSPPKFKEEIFENGKFKYKDVVSDWLQNNFDADWNSYKCKQEDQKSRLESNWTIVNEGLPFASSLWRSYACLLASNAKIALKPYMNKTDWMNGQLFTAHISRLCLMLSDHYYSSREPNEKWQDGAYEVWANSDRETKELKQRLDEHLIGVSDTSQKIAKALPKLNTSLDSLQNNDYLESKVEKKYQKNFGWQDEAKKVAEDIAKSTTEHGFFGINMASTGKGKTLANAKIMNAIGGIVGRTRFSVALGLRTLTLQTGKEYREKLELSDEDLAIMVGGAAVRQLFENEQSKESQTSESSDEYDAIGSESLEESVSSDTTIDYKGAITKHSLSEWTRQEKSLDQLINAPLLVCTIDHLMPATEGISGGKQIAPMLRLLTSDLILDEPDDFGLEDLPALCRLVHMAGMLGSRVLLSTATMPPSLAYALFLAYQDGWKEYAKANLAREQSVITCAWFDEFKSDNKPIQNIKEYEKAHEHFVKHRIKKLNEETVHKRLGKLANIDLTNGVSVLQSVAETIHSTIKQLHGNHHQSRHNNKKNVSFGLVRMANIDPLVTVATKLLRLEVPEDTRIYYCIYHSHYPLAVRSYIESQLDMMLQRYKPESRGWELIDEKIKDSHIRHHIFVVLASPVAEVGRDHDYDWAIVEPSSMRSIIQLAGRILRHRYPNEAPQTANVLLLNKNYRALSGKRPCFIHPGFELDGLKAENGYDLNDILHDEQYAAINAIPRIVAPSKNILKSSSWSNLVELEHMALTRQLFTGKKPANVWWKYHPQWSGEVQRQQPFRKSQKDEPYYLWIQDERSNPKWKWKNEHVKPAIFGVPSGTTISDYSIEEIADGNLFWFDLDAQTIYSQLAKELGIESLEEVSQRFGEVRLIEYEKGKNEYFYHPNLGLFQRKDNE